MSGDNRKDYIQRLEQVLQHSYPTCINCEHWDRSSNQCIKVDQTPPPPVIAYGCEEWQEAIPF